MISNKQVRIELLKVLENITNKEQLTMIHKIIYDNMKPENITFDKNSACVDLSLLSMEAVDKIYKVIELNNKGLVRF